MEHASTNIGLTPVYASVCANRHENIISCNKTYLLYSRSHCLVIHNLASSAQVPNLFAGHTDEVNGQCFIVDPNSSDKDDRISSYVISTAYDKSAIFWEFSRDAKSHIEHKILHRVKSPNDEVFTTRCAIKRSSDGSFLSVTSTIDGSIQLWNNAELVQTIATRYCYLHSRLHTITRDDGNHFSVVLLAGSDNKIHVFQLNESTPTLKHLFDLGGHTDWVKHLDIVDLVGRPREFLLASASQDSFIRVWHCKLIDYEIGPSQIRTIVSDYFEQDASGKPTSSRMTATLETVLSGHDGIVHGLCWFKKSPKPIIQLMSCSADKTIVLWQSRLAEIMDPGEHQQLNRYEQCPASAEIWKENHRLGETGETNLPFLGVCLSDDESTLYAHSLHGAIHSWRLNHEPDKWLHRPFITGHFEPVTDLAWERTGAYLLSSSLDKTCRMHAIASSDDEWHEITRPQVHGHEINCLVSLGFSKFATGAEEKTIRTFEATQFFVKNFKSLSKLGLPNTELALEELPPHAQLPALGLSNRGAMSPYDLGDDQENKNSNWYKISPLVEQLAKVEHLKSLPIEEILLQSTLWWETNKLFGHGNELHALAVDSKGTFLASASKANRPDLASILVWECSKFRKVATIEHHSLTITRLRFSPDDNYLLSVSRDRTWCLSERTGQLRLAYKKFVGTSKSNANHGRIIWDCSWTHDSKYFVTVSRDKMAILWSIEKLVRTSETIECSASHQFDCSIQAVDSPNCQYAESANVYLFAFGLENGNLELHLISETQWQPMKLFKRLHHLPIRRLSFKPPGEDQYSRKYGSNRELTLASAGDDCIVKLTRCYALLFI